jgi:hypothetical protein
MDMGLPGGCEHTAAHAHGVPARTSELIAPAAAWVE